MNWFSLKNPAEIDSPALLVYKNRVQHNIELMIQIAGNSERLIPHVKTHKMLEIVQMQLKMGIRKFKCATIAEAEMLVQAGAKWILIAYQLVSPKTQRFVALVKANPDVHFSSLVDCPDSGNLLNEIFKKEHLIAHVFIDVNNGMNRTGHEINSKLLPLYWFLADQSNLIIEGFHVYDGHIRNTNFEERKKQSTLAFEEFNNLIINELYKNNIHPMIIAGGSPTFTVHALRQDIFCSPGTCLLWDWGYGDSFIEQDFQHAALILTRIISKPREGIITIDLGHKAVAAENSIDKRIRFLNLKDYQLLSQSEEHGVVEIIELSNWEALKIGDVLYGLPYHICPTVNLYDEVNIIIEGELSEIWQVLARKRKLSF